MRSVTQWRAILRIYKLSFESIQEYMNADQGFRVAKKLLSDGDVRGLVLEDEEKNSISVSAFVHAHMNNTTWYNVTLKLSHQSVIESGCACQAGILTHMRCKHVGALLCAVLALKEFSNQDVEPKEFRRSNMKRFEGAKESVRKAVGADLTWDRILQEITTDPDKKREGVMHNDKFQTTPKHLQKKTKNKNPATLEAMTMKQLKATILDLNERNKLSLNTTGTKAQLIERIKQNRTTPPSQQQLNQILQKEPQVSSQKSKKRKLNTNNVNTSSNKEKRRRMEFNELISDSDKFLRTFSPSRRVTNRHVAK
jgi:hypothetical protein